MTAYHPPPNLRIIDKPISAFQAHRREQVLQVGLQPINGGPVEWQDVPVIREEDLTSDNQKGTDSWTAR